MKGCKVQIDKYTAVYEAVASVSSEQLEKSMGKEVEANEETYYVSGHNDLQYIIRKTAEHICYGNLCTLKVMNIHSRMFFL